MINRQTASTLISILALMSYSICSQAQNPPNNLLSGYISKDTANIMISSYQSSIAGGSNTETDLSSLSFDAAHLRNYLNADTTITGIKLTLAHTMEYITGGGLNQNCGYKSGALTIIISGYDAQGNYKYINTNDVMDYGTPCPTNCPTSFAASPFFNNQ